MSPPSSQAKLPTSQDDKDSISNKWADFTPQTIDKLKREEENYEKKHQRLEYYNRLYPGLLKVW